jgi:hypothetical protein
MARQAILLHEGVPAKQHILLARTLEFFGVPYKFADLSTFPESSGSVQDQVVFGSVAAIATAYQRAEAMAQLIGHFVAFYAYADDDLSAAKRGIRSILDDPRISLHEAPEGYVPIHVSPQLVEVSGPMAAIEIHARMRKEDTVLVGYESQLSKVVTVIAASGTPVYVRIDCGSVPIYLCTSRYVIDIDQEVLAGYYDVKEHFCSTVPLVSFIRLMFQEVGWRPSELGACLIIDDPLLRKRYGFCDFENLRRLMLQYGFTTNIAFIPWNWRRTSPQAKELFGGGSGEFSVSIHGCDHVKAEFGDWSPDILCHRVRLAQGRMQMHEDRTGIHHDPVMVFPYGIFSSASPAILKGNGLIAAVNTQTSPVDDRVGCTRIRDVWDVAIMRYGDFAIFTRRYADHGLENFAFDLLLGKPCLIAAHHEFFRDECNELIGLLESLRARNCILKWRPLGEVIRRACRRRTNDSGAVEVEMYGAELLVCNPEEHEIRAHIRRKEANPETVLKIESDQTAALWHAESGWCTFEAAIAANSDRRFRVYYRGLEQMQKIKRSVAFKSSVAARRILCELADTCVGRSSFVNIGRARQSRVSTNNEYQTGSPVSLDL